MPDDEDAAAGGWISYASPEGGGTHMHLVRAADRWVIDQVYVHGAEITASIMQEVPLSQIDLIMNLGPIGLFDLETLVRFGAYFSGDYPILHDGGAEPSLVKLRGQITAETAREFRLMEPAAAKRQKLTRPDGSDPDGFYAQVGAAYREYALQTRAPAIRIAAEAEVPVGTARSWIREARRRGALPPGLQGKAG